MIMLMSIVEPPSHIHIHVVYSYVCVGARARLRAVAPVSLGGARGDHPAAHRAHSGRAARRARRDAAHESVLAASAAQDARRAGVLLYSPLLCPARPGPRSSLCSPLLSSPLELVACVEG